ncbi:uncharacterized protein [Nicotiana tomentosiformis]|uniref:uncharacterized protein n=1 Tax=Nicotiana tomentosiformis TaxID=4098 RepID=UPI00388CB89D
MPYSECSWRELSKGRWEARSHGLSKDVKLRPPTGSKVLPTESPAPREVEEKKRKRALSPPSSEKKKTRRLLEVEVRGLTEKRDTYKLLSERREGEAKSLRAELELARKEHANLVEQVKIFEVSDDELDSVTNDRNPQVQQKIDRINQLRAELDIVKAEAEEWRRRMDRLALEKETARAQLTSVEVQLQAAKEKIGARAQKVEELQSQLSSVVSDRETLAKELEMAKSVVVVVKDDADEIVAQYKADAEAAQDRLKDIVEQAVIPKGGPRGNSCSRFRLSG